jgi:ATP-dependent exoDNAse (exonuclease V) alpha subunit
LRAALQAARCHRQRCAHLFYAEVKMAIFHLSLKTISRAKGRSAVAASAYRAGVRLNDNRLGQIFDYRKKRGVASAQILLPSGAPVAYSNRELLWNGAEQAETRKNATVAREFEIALPSELNPEQRKKLASDFARELCERHKFAVDVAIHEPGKWGDNRNHHAHILTSTRRLEANGFGPKCRELDDQKSGEVVRWRERWAQLVNSALEAAAVHCRVDHRSLAEQGVDREPSLHLGPTKTAILRRLSRAHSHPDNNSTKLTPSQERSAQQLATMRSRLAKSNLEKFKQVSIVGNQTKEKGVRNDIDKTPTP